MYDLNCIPKHSLGRQCEQKNLPLTHPLNGDVARACNHSSDTCGTAAKGTLNRFLNLGSAVTVFVLPTCYTQQDKCTVFCDWDDSALKTGLDLSSKHFK
mmetsp:Transcript_61565/g.102440  ORF Transcript_61565/g.102440 Transcript_61565/m.102440 type:complete len:99 (+) Transcript_61565:109-405(+)